jgi:hypothetical protein
VHSSVSSYNKKHNRRIAYCILHHSTGTLYYETANCSLLRKRIDHHLLCYSARSKDEATPINLKHTRENMSSGLESINVKDILKVLHPKRYASFHENPNDCKNKKQQRFSTLLLEHSEQKLHDWGVVASSSRVRGTSSLENNMDTATSMISLSSSMTSPSIKKSRGSTHKLDPNYSKTRKEREPGTTMKRIHGRLHLCSKSIIFEPHDVSRGIIRIPYDKMTTQNAFI